MATVIWSQNSTFLTHAAAKIMGVLNTDWLGFLDALGKVEGNDSYSADNGLGYIGIYQFASFSKNDIFATLNFADNIGTMLNVASDEDYKTNPIAQELSALMEFSGTAPVANTFASRFRYVRSAANAAGIDLGSSNFDKMIGQTFTLQWTDTNGAPVFGGQQTITLTPAGISAAAHLVGQGGVAFGMKEIYDQAYDKVTGVLISPAPVINLSITDSTAIGSSYVGLADGNGIAFSTYVQIFQNFDISTLTTATDAQFNKLAQDLITYRKDKIVSYLTDNQKNVSINNTDPNYQGSAEAILTGLNLPTDQLSNVDGHVVLAGGDFVESVVSISSDLIIGLGTGAQKLEGSTGNDFLVGGAGSDTYGYTTGGGFDTIIDYNGDGYGGDGQGQIIIDGRAIAGGDQFGDSRVHRDADGRLYVDVGTGLVIDGNIFVQDWQAGSLGISMSDTAAADVISATSKDIIGDPVIHTGTLSGSGSTPSNWYVVSPAIDNGDGTWTMDYFLIDGDGNPTEPGGPGWNDRLRGTSASEHIKGLVGQDGIYATSGGNDFIEAGDGPGSILLPGNKSYALISDYVEAGSGNDHIYANSYVDAATAIKLGNTQANQSKVGLSASGGAGNDVIVGSDGLDILIGDEGSDLLIGGAGNDVIEGSRDWNSTKILRECYGTEADAALNFLAPGTRRENMMLADTAGDVIYAGEGSDFAVGSMGNDIIFGENGKDALVGFGGNDVILGGNDDDTIYGDYAWGVTDTRDGNDYLDGGEGKDTIYGNAGDDILLGGRGDDTLNGGTGQDTYIYNVGDGIDTINDTKADKNILRFGVGVDKNNIKLNLGSLMLDLGNGDAIHINNEDQAGANGFDRNDVFNSSSISSFEFADGSVLSARELLARGFDLDGTMGDDTLLGTNTTDRINGLAGDDLLDGGAADDILNGGTGNDTLIGGTGSDTYIFNRGDGQDIICEQGDSVSIDILQFGADILQSDVSFRRTPAGELEISLNTLTDKITIQNWYIPNPDITRIERIVFGDGSTLTPADFESLPIAGTGGDDVIAGTGGNDAILGLAGNDSLDGASGNDVLDGGTGNDTIDGGAGDDTLLGGDGVDTYLFSFDMGMDTVIDASAGGNSIQLQGLGFSSLSATQSGNDLLLKIRGTGQGMTLKDYYRTPQEWTVTDGNGVQQTMTDVLTATANQDEYSVLRDDFLTAQIAQISTDYAAHSALGTAVTAYHSKVTTTTTTNYTWLSGGPDSSTTSTTVNADTRYFAEGMGPWGYLSLFDQQTGIQNTAIDSDAAYIVADTGQVSSSSGRYVQAALNLGTPYNVSSSQLQTITLYPFYDSFGLMIGQATETAQIQTDLSWQDGSVVSIYADASVAPPQTVLSWLASRSDTFNLQEITGGASDNTIDASNNRYAMVNGGAGNDTLIGGGLSFGGEGNDMLIGGTLQYGGNGNDVLIGGDAMSGGAGDDVMEGGAASSRYLIDPAQTGIDLIRDTGDSEIAYKDWYYRSLGIADWQLRDMWGGYYTSASASSDTGYFKYDDPNNPPPAGVTDPVYIEPLPSMNRPAAFDYAALQAAYAAGVIPADTVEFGAGIALADMQLSWGETMQVSPVSGANELYRTLNLSWNGGASQVQLVIPHIDDPLGSGVEQIKFADGTVVAMQELIALAPAGVALDPRYPDISLALTGTEGADRLTGLWGNDTLSGLGGDDVLIGGAGSDLLSGGAGADTYVLNLGGGQDTVIDNAGEGNVLQFGAGITAKDVSFQVQGNDVLIGYGPGDSVLVRNFDIYGLNGTATPIDTYRFTDGSSITVSVGTNYDVAGSYEICKYDAQGSMIESRWAYAVGSNGLSTFNPDGSSNRTFQFADGEHGSSIQYADGSFSETYYYADGSYDSVTGDGQGHWNGLYYDASGIKVRGWWSLADGSWGEDAFNADGSASGTIHQADGTSSSYVNNGLGDITTTCYDAANVKVSVNWTKADGSNGIETFNADGSSSGARINGSAFDDVITGTSSSDVLNALAGNDTLIGGAGDDTLMGGAGNDTYIINAGDGVDTIIDNFSGSENNTIVFGAGVDPASIKLFQGSLGIDLGNGTVVHIQGVDYNDIVNTSAIQSFRFADGTVLTTQQLVARGFDTAGGSGNDALSGTNVSDRITAGAGDDTLSGGRGNDVLDGGTGSDSYLFNSGDGADVIVDGSRGGTEVNTLVLGAGLTPSMISAVISATGEVTLDFGNGDSVQINRIDDLSVQDIQFADGSVVRVSSLLNSAPVAVLPIASQTTHENATFSFTVPRGTFIDSDQAAVLTYTAALADGSALPGWLVFDPLSQSFAGIPGNADAGSLDIVLTATDAGGLSASAQFNLAVANTITGTGYNDILNGTSGTDYVEALTGNDVVNGGDGNDTVIGGAGSDVLAGGAGDDTFLIEGTDAGYDRFQGDAGYDVIQGSSADDVIRVNYFAGASTVEKIDGGAGMNVIAGTQYNDIIDLSGTELVNIANIDGGIGNDVITGSAGNDTLIGGTGSDVLAGGAGDDTFQVDGADAGYDRFQGDAGYDLIQGGAADDVIRVNYFAGASTVERIDGGAGVNSIAGTQYNDTIDLSGTELANIANVDGGIGNDVITGSSGNDTIIGGAGSDVLAGGAGDDVFMVSGTDTAYDRFQGDAGLDVIQGSAGDDVIRLNYFSGASTVEKIDGGAGLNTIAGTQYNDTIDLFGTELLNIANVDAGVGNDVITGSAGNDTVIGGAGSDVLAGGAGDDTFLINGTDTGYDRFQGDAGYDVIQGSSGDDVIRVNYFAGTSTVEKIDGGAGLDIIAGTQYNDTIDLSGTELVNIANIDGGIGNDVITGSASGDVIIGGTGSDVMAGGAGDDTFLISGTDTGYDRFQGDAGYDVIQGTLGDDVIRVNYFAGSSSVEKIDGGAGFNIVEGTQYNDTIDLSGTELVNIAKIDGGAGNDSIAGSAGHDLLLGGEGSDTVNGSSGNDILLGGMGNDRLTDTSGNNILDGGEGADVLVGGAGNEFLAGGTGNDSITTGDGADVIAFGRGDGMDIVNGGVGTDNTISLGKGINYADLALSKVNNDLILEVGGGEQITLSNWYNTSANYKSVIDLQVMADAMAAFDPTSADPLLNQAVQNFDFTAIVNAFDQTRGTSATLMHWSATNSLLAAHLSGSDATALGGDLAHQYGTNGSLAGMNLTAAQTALNDAQFGGAAQTLRPLQGLQGGAVTL